VLVEGSVPRGSEVDSLIDVRSGPDRNGVGLDRDDGESNLYSGQRQGDPRPVPAVDPLPAITSTRRKKTTLPARPESFRSTPGPDPEWLQTDRRSGFCRNPGCPEIEPGLWFLASDNYFHSGRATAMTVCLES